MTHNLNTKPLSHNQSQLPSLPNGAGDRRTGAATILIFFGCNWLEPVSNRFSGYFRSRSGYFWISKKGNQFRSRLAARALKNRTGPDP